MLRKCKWLLSVTCLLFILFQESSAIPPPGYQQRLQAIISLRDYLNNGVGGVSFSMRGEIGWYDAYGQPQVVTKYASGYTDGAGNLYLYVEFILGEEYDYPVQYMWMSVWLTNGDPPNYSVLEKTEM